MEKISVIIALYNCAPYLERCLESILHQTYTNLEVLISDDCSTDNSLEIARRYALQDERVKVFSQPKNTGVLKQYNFLFSQATGDYLAIQDSDDWSHPQRLEKQRDILATYHDILVCGTGATFCYPYKKVECLERNDMRWKGATFNYYFAPATIMFKRDVLNKIPGMNEWFDLGTSMDRYFVTEILEMGEAYYLNELLYYVGVRANSNHKIFSKKKIITLRLCEKFIEQRIDTGSDWLLEKNWDAIKEYEKSVLKDRKLISGLYRHSAVFDVEFNNFDSAIRNLRRSFYYNVNILNIRTFLFFLRKYIKAGILSRLSIRRRVS